MSDPGSQRPAVSQQRDNDPDRSEVTARTLVAQQHHKQKRRRTSASGRGSSIKTSLWSTLAAKLSCDEGVYKYYCAVCGFEGSMNKSMSMSNVIEHYKTRHRSLREVLIRMNQQNATEETLRSRITAESRKYRRTNRSFFTTRNAEGNDSTLGKRSIAPPGTSQKTIKAVAIIMFSCATESPCSRIASPLLQGLVDVFGGRVQYASKQPVEQMLFDTYMAVCRILRKSVTHVKTGCITVDGWSAALGAPILGMTWHYIDNAWNMRCVPISTLNMGMASKTGAQLRLMIEEILQQNPIVGSDVGSDDIRVHTATSDNDGVGSRPSYQFRWFRPLRCAHSCSLCERRVRNGNSLEKISRSREQSNLLLQLPPESCAVARRGATVGWRIKRSPTAPKARYTNAVALASGCDVRVPQPVWRHCRRGRGTRGERGGPSLSTDQEDVLAEFVTVLTEVRRVARPLEADRKVTMSRAPRFLRELHETLLIMAGSLLPPQSLPNQAFDGFSIDDSVDMLDMRAMPATRSSAEADKERDESRLVRLRKNHPQGLSIRLADRIEARLGALWKPVDEDAASWVPDSDEDAGSNRQVHQPRRVLLFHVAAILDVNECSLDFLSVSEDIKDSYVKLLRAAVVREARELDGALAGSASEMEVLFGLFHKTMLHRLTTSGRREPGEAHSFWREANKEERPLISPVAFNTVARAALSSQASSAPAERLFSDLGHLQGNQSQSLLSSTLKMTEMIRVFVRNELKDIRLPQSGVLHPEAAGFRRVVHSVAKEIGMQ